MRRIPTGRPPRAANNRGIPIAIRLVFFSRLSMTMSAFTHHAAARPYTFLVLALTASAAALAQGGGAAAATRCRLAQLRSDDRRLQRPPGLF